MIRATRVRVIDPEGRQLGVLNTDEALRLAQDQFGLDLVEISPTAVPPVCKILDFGKHKYQIKKKAQEAKRNQNVIQVKEVKLRPQTDEHDLDFKIRHVQRFLKDGNKAKVTVFFRGREVVYSEQGRELLQKVFAHVQDLGFIEQEPLLEGRYMSIIVAPKSTKGQPRNAENENKKGSGEAF
jgi:translation initiation factor IF-3